MLLQLVSGPAPSSDERHPFSKSECSSGFPAVKWHARIPASSGAIHLPGYGPSDLFHSGPSGCLQNRFSLTSYDLLTILNFFPFHLRSNHVPTNDKLRLDRQLLSSQFQRFLGYRHRYTVGFEQNTAWFDYCSPVLRVTFTFTHTYFLWLLGNRLVRENADPYIPFTLHSTGQGLTGSFQLAISQPDRFQRFQSIRTKGNSITSLSRLTDTTFLPFPMLCSFRL